MAMVLQKGSQGQTYVITALRGQIETNRHLTNMGFRVGERLTVISHFSSTLILRINDNTFGIDDRIAGLVEVE